MENQNSPSSIGKSLPEYVKFYGHIYRVPEWQDVDKNPFFVAVGYDIGLEEVTPITKEEYEKATKKSCVEEFLESCKAYETISMADAEEFMGIKSTIWLQEFCKELEQLLKIKKIAEEFEEHLKTKNQK